MTTLTRAERIEEYKATIDAEIDRLRDLRENERDAERWLKLDADIDSLLIQKDNAAVEIDAALDEIVAREIHLGRRMIVTASFAERWTDNPDHYREHFGIDDVEVYR